LAAGRAAKAAGTVLGIFIAELQYVEENELAALITAMHGCAQQQVPVVLVGAGLPQLRGRMGQGKSYAERLFAFPEVGALLTPAAHRAITKPVVDEGAAISDEAVARILDATKGYPYFLQEWGKHSWDAAPASPITAQDVAAATAETIASLDENFFRVRFDRLTPAERDGRVGPWSASVGRHCGCAAARSHVARPYTQRLDRQGHDLEPQPRRHRLHRTAVRRVHEADRAGPRLAVARGSLPSYRIGTPTAPIEYARHVRTGLADDVQHHGDNTYSALMMRS
jgi:hypothetical protein